MAEERETIVVTSAALSATDERLQRQRRYLLTQVVRAACFLLAVVLPVPIWVKLLFIVGAFALPWMGVVTANAGPKREKERDNVMVDRLEPVRLQLDPGRTIDQE